MRNCRAVSSEVERYLDTVEVRGSIPLSPTIGNPGLSEKSESPFSYFGRC